MKLRHYDFDGRARFITFCTHRRLPLLLDDDIRLVICEAIDRARSSGQFRLLAYVIMPEHVHLVLHPGESARMGNVIGEMKHKSAKAILPILKQKRAGVLPQLTVIRNRAPRLAFWQRRCYDHNCRSEESLWEKVAYCHNNPVKRGLVEAPEEWKWSSYRWYAGLPDVPLQMDHPAD
jgi:putative transposase